jgi:hypothetical protein
MRRLFEAVRSAAAVATRCELCAMPIGTVHEHLFAVEAREVRCTCDPCARLVDGARWRRIPRRADRVALPDADAWLARIGVPVGVAALTARDGGERGVVLYPGPIGLAEHAVPPALWTELRQRIPPLEPDVEALLFSRLGGVPEVLLVGIDVVFRLVAEVRARWTGMTGGPEAAAAVGRMLVELGGDR